MFFGKGWQFLFYNLDGSEPPHVHARKDDKELKIWLESLAVARNRRCKSHEISDLLSVTGEKRNELLERWHGHFGN